MVTVGVYDIHDEDILHQQICTRNMLIENELRLKYKCNRLRICTGIYFITKENNNIDAETVISNCNLARKIARENNTKNLLLFSKKKWLPELITK